MPPTITLSLTLSGQCRDTKVGDVGIYSTQDFRGNVIKFMQMLEGQASGYSAKKPVAPTRGCILACREYEKARAPTASLIPTTALASQS